MKPEKHSVKAEESHCRRDCCLSSICDCRVSGERWSSPSTGGLYSRTCRPLARALILKSSAMRLKTVTWGQGRRAVGDARQLAKAGVGEP